jgi:CheY-like chemotaxis protein
LLGILIAVTVKATVIFNFVYDFTTRFNKIMKKVLIVEDYEDSRKFMKTLVESYGYRVIEAIDGEQAIQMAKYGHPDLILMDLAMPIMDGLATTRVIRGFEEIERMPIVIVSAFGEDYHRQALEAGCDDLISKPVDISVLEPILNKYLAQ